MELIELRGGLTVPLGDLQFLWALETLGMTCEVVADKLRVQGPDGTKPNLSEEDVTYIKARKPHLLALYGFDIMTPQQRGLFDALQAAGTKVLVCAPEPREAGVLSGLPVAWARSESSTASSQPDMWARNSFSLQPR